MRHVYNIILHTHAHAHTHGRLACLAARQGQCVCVLYSRFVAVFVKGLANAVSDLEQWEGLVCLLIVSYRIGGGEQNEPAACSEDMDRIQNSPVEVGAQPGVTAILCHFPFDAIFGYKKRLPDQAIPIQFAWIRIKIK